MKVTINRIRKYSEAPKELFAFGDSINATLEVNEREHPSKGMRYYARFEYCEIKNGGVLVGVSGDGDTINSAIKNYAKQISGKQLIFGAFSSHRREINAPALFYKPRKEYK